MFPKNVHKGRIPHLHTFYYSSIQEYSTENHLLQCTRCIAKDCCLCLQWFNVTAFVLFTSMILTQILVSQSHVVYSGILYCFQQCLMDARICS